MSASTAVKTSASRSGMVSTVGPVSNVKPSRSSRPARPPGRSSRSMTSTCQPRPARWHAADRPPRPAPMTTARRVIVLAIRPGCTAGGAVRLRPVASGRRRGRPWPAPTSPAISHSTASTAPLHLSRSHSSSSSSSVRSGEPARARRRRPAASVRRMANASTSVGLPSRRSAPTGLPVHDGSPSTPSRSSRSWNASPNGAPKAE